MKRRDTLTLAAALALPGIEANADAPAGAAQKVLRVVFPVAETGFDPAQLSDLYSRTAVAHIFDALYEFDHLARPVKLRPRVALAIPEHSDDYRVWTVRLRQGVLFDEHEAFKGAKRELVAQDFVYSMKRIADPANKSPIWSTVEELKFIGLAELRQKALKDKKPFDYDTPVEGLRALDRHTLQYRLAQSNPRFVEVLADSSVLGALAREVVEFYGGTAMEHPVGTGPYRLAKWRRSSQMVFERNPNYREVLWDADPAPDDVEGQAIKKRLQGRRMPLVDRVEVAIIDESQPRWLSFVNGQIDFVAVPQEFVPVATPNGVLAPNLKKKNIQSWRVLLPFTQLSYFNMEHPLVGGLEPHKVALRRAVWLSMDVAQEIRLAFRGQAIQAQSIIQPHTGAYHANFKSENSDFDPARARALLDLYGYVDRDGDGWREQPDGQPLVLECASQTDGLSRQRDELMKKGLDAIGVQVVFKTAKWPENLKAARNGKLMMWRVGTSASVTDSQEVLQRLYGPQAGLANLARFKLPAFDAVFDRLTALPDGPEREALFDQAARIAIAYAPYKVHLHQYNDLVAHPWLDGYRRPLFWTDRWHQVDVDMARRPATA